MGRRIIMAMITITITMRPITTASRTTGLIATTTFAPR
jgi:hypothetical protein